MKPKMLMTSLAAASLVALGAWGGLEANGKWFEARAQGAPAASSVPAAGTPSVQAMPEFSSIVEANKASVVNITVSSTEKAGAAPSMPDLGGDDPFSQFFRRFQVPAPEQHRRGL